MKAIKKFLFSCLAMAITLPLLSGEGKMAKANGIDIWYETFGKKDDPALLLIMGGFCQGIMWPTEFCEKLAREGFYVIRYDHRDTGLSTCFDFKKQPYNLLDMAKDGIGLLDALRIEKADLVGLSMGGPIAELMSVHFPSRVSTITLMATSCDFYPMSMAYDEVPTSTNSLSRPKEIYLQWMLKFLKAPPQTTEEALEMRVDCWRILNGTVIPFEEQYYRELHREFLSRIKHPESMTNHLDAIKNSFDLVRTIPRQVKVPTLIMHGSEDTIFPPDHGQALAKEIQGSTFIPVHGFGHVPNGYFYDMFIANIKKLTIQQKNSEKFAALRALDLPVGDYAIAGSGPLGIRNLRAIGDIDLIVTSALWDKLAAKYGVKDENGVKKIVLSNGLIEAFGESSFYTKPKDPQAPSMAERIAKAEMIEGLPFVSLESVLYFKRKMARDKDLNDIALIEAHLKR